MEKILVVEDEADVNSGICELLKTAGYDVISAYNGKEALKLLESTIPDLVISDIMMPGKNGYQLLDEFQQKYGPYNIPFIFLTAKAYYDDIREGMKYGADDYLIKPFKAKDLLEAVESRLKKSKKQREFFNEIANNISAYIPHELRTPMVGILGFHHLIIENSDDFSKEEIVEMVKRINTSLHRLNSRIEKFITYADVASTLNNKILLKEIRNKFTKQNPANLLAITADELAAKNERIRDIQLDLQPAEVALNEMYFKIAIKELIENAIKFSNKNSPIKIKGEFKEERYKIEIENISNSDFNLTNPRKIIPFFQFKREENNQIGNGLGLPIAHAALEILNAFFNILREGNKIKMLIEISTE